MICYKQVSQEEGKEIWEWKWIEEIFLTTMEKEAIQNILSKDKKYGGIILPHNWTSSV